MHEDQSIGLKSPTEQEPILRNDRPYGHSSPGTRKDVVLATVNMYCSICDATPCYLLLSAAMAVMQEQCMESEGANLIGAVRYEQSLEKLHKCLIRHHEITQAAWQTPHIEVSERALAEIARLRREQKQYLHKEARDPPSLN